MENVREERWALDGERGRISIGRVKEKTYHFQNHKILHVPLNSDINWFRNFCFWLQIDTQGMNIVLLATCKSPWET